MNRCIFSYLFLHFSLKEGKQFRQAVSIRVISMLFLLLPLQSVGQFSVETYAAGNNRLSMDSLKVYAKTTKNNKLKVDLLCQIVNRYVNMNLDSAEVWTKISLDYAHSKKDIPLEAAMLYLSACTKQNQSKFIEAISLLDKSLQLKKKLGWKDTIVNLHVMALVYSDMREIKKAQYYFDRAEKAVILKGKGDSLELCNQLINRAMLYLKIQELEKATSCILKAKALATPYKDPYNLRMALLLSAIEIYVANERFSAAEIELNEALITLEEIPKAAAISSEVFYWQAYLQHHKKAYAQALETLNKGRDSTLKTRYVLKLSKYYALYSDIYAAMGNNSLAYDYLKKKQSIMDSLHSDFALERLIVLKDSVNYAQMVVKEAEIQQTKKNNRFILTLSATILTIVLLLLYIFRRMMIQRQTLKELDYQANLAAKNKENLDLQSKLNDKLNELVIEKTQALETSFKEIEDLKNRENATLALHNHQYQMFRDNLSSLVEEWVQKNSLAESPQLNNIRLALKQRQHKDQDWQNFILHFEQVNPQFYQTLQQKYPDLTQNDLKHCAYIKLNISRKEVAELMSISDEAVRMARNRLKKKLGIDTKVSLASFLAEIENDA